jgi:hypothetical protein
MPEEKDGAVPKERIQRKHWKRLQTMATASKEAFEGFQKWQEEKLAKLNYWPDQVNWDTGVVLADTADERGMRPIQARLSHEVLKEAKAQFEKVIEARERLDKAIKLVAVQYQVFPDCINVRSGEITRDYEEAKPALSEDETQIRLEAEDGESADDALAALEVEAERQAEPLAVEG